MIRFAIDEKGILVSNNEARGFNEADVRSLSDIGHSTKQQGSTHGSTGKKGIGFKSVFALSRSPIVWSGAFQLCFDTSELGGEIAPKWLEQLPWHVELPAGFTTHFYLPTDQPLDGAQLLAELKSESLLFLRRIKQVHLVLQEAKTVLSVVREGSDVATVHVQRSGHIAASSARRFIMVADDPASSIRCAIPDPAWLTLLDAEQRSFSVATFLPVLDVGFPFVVQARSLSPFFR